MSINSGNKKLSYTVEKPRDSIGLSASNILRSIATRKSRSDFLLVASGNKGDIARGFEDVLVQRPQSC